MHKRLLFFDHDSDGGINILFCCRSLLCLFYSLFYFIILFVYNFLQIIFLLFPRVSQQSLTEGSSCNVVFIRNGSHKGIIQFLFHVRSRDHDQTMDNGPKGAPLVKTFVEKDQKRGEMQSGNQSNCNVFGLCRKKAFPLGDCLDRQKLQ